MAHSFDSTLLQRMGFKDPDRQTSEHDRACVAIATKPQIILDALGVPSIPWLPARVSLEQPLQKGDGKYASTVGFIDAIIEFDIFDSECGEEWRTKKLSERRCAKCGGIDELLAQCAPCDSYRRYTHETLIIEGPSRARYSREVALVEVKTRLDSVGDLLRQMNLYREYKRDHHHTRISRYVVWSLTDGDEQYATLLLGQGYELVVGQAPRLPDGSVR